VKKDLEKRPRAVLHRDMNDLGEIWTLHAAEALRVCRAYVGRDHADDALGRVAVAAQCSFTRGAIDVDHPRAWLLTITRHVCFDIYRERGRAAVECVSDVALERVAARSALRLDYGNPERQYLARERIRCMKSALDALAPELRESLRSIVEGESGYDALAQALGISPAALRKRMQRARALLRRQLKEGERTWTAAPRV
jgi:RNA polymerase sigma factor (sigma-70 family)